MTYLATEKQQHLLNFIKASMAGGGDAPSFDEMMQATGLKSKSTVHDHLVRLEQRGLIRRLPGNHRAIEVVGTVADRMRAALFLIANDEGMTADECRAVAVGALAGE